MICEKTYIIKDNIEHICCALKSEGVNINAEAILASFEAGTFDVFDFTSLVDDAIQDVLYNSSYSISNISPEKFGNMVTEVITDNAGKLSIKRVSDYLPTDDNKIAAIQLGNRWKNYESVLLTSDKGTTYRLLYTFKNGLYPNENICIEKINRYLPKEYQAKQLSEIITQILSPLIDYKHNLGNNTDEFMRAEMTKVLPFHPHVGLTMNGLSIVKNWEYCINQGNRRFTRDSVQQIVNCIIANLSEYFENIQEYASWDKELSDVITKLKEL